MKRETEVFTEIFAAVFLYYKKIYSNKGMGKHPAFVTENWKDFITNDLKNSTYDTPEEFLGMHKLRLKLIRPPENLK